MLENRVVNIIKKIRDSRSRPSAQNILEFIKRGAEFSINMETLKGILCVLTERSIIYDGVKGGQESIIYDGVKGRQEA